MPFQALSRHFAVTLFCQCNLDLWTEHLTRTRCDGDIRFELLARSQFEFIKYKAFGIKFIVEPIADLHYGLNKYI